MVELDLVQRVLALDDAGCAVDALLLDDLVEPAGLLDVLGHVRRKRNRHLPAPRQRQRELGLLERLHDPLRLRHELGLAQPARRLRRNDEPLRVLRAHVAVDPEPHRLGTKLGDRIARIDPLRAALVTEVAARAVPDPVLVVVGLEPGDLVSLARIADEPETLGQGGRPEELGIRLHRVALGDAAAAHDAERLLVDRRHLLGCGEELALGNLLVARVEPRLHGLHLRPERPHVDDQVLDDREVPHRGDHRHVPGLGDVQHSRLAGEHGGPVHSHAARAADHHAAALAVRERAVVAVLDDVEAVEKRRLFGSVDLVLPKHPLAACRIEPPDLEAYLHVIVPSSALSSWSRPPGPSARRGSSPRRRAELRRPPRCRSRRTPSSRSRRRPASRR